jgi:DNA-binding FadR family transcriptional regulator
MNQGKERSLVMRVVDRLVGGIVTGAYPDNLLPPQDVLSKQFDVSRTVMREALSMLISRHMLDVRPKTGTRIKPMRDWQMVDEELVQWRFRAKPDPDFLRDLVEFREFIEPRAARLAATRASAAERAAIRSAYDAFSHATPGDEAYRQADDALHTAIVHASGNQILQQMAPIVRAALSTTASIVSPSGANADAIRKAHARVVDAIEARDPSAADAAMVALISFAKDEIQRELNVDAH